MDLDRIRSKEEYESVIAYLEEKLKNPPDGFSEEADLIFCLGTLALEWAEENLPKDKKD